MERQSNCSCNHRLTITVSFSYAMSVSMQHEMSCVCCWIRCQATTDQWRHQTWPPSQWSSCRTSLQPAVCCRSSNDDVPCVMCAIFNHDAWTLTNCVLSHVQHFYIFSPARVSYVQFGNSYYRLHCVWCFDNNFIPVVIEQFQCAFMLHKVTLRK